MKYAELKRRLREAQDRASALAAHIESMTYEPPAERATPWLHCAGDLVRVRDEDGRESVCVLMRGTVTDTMGRTHKIGS